MDASTLHLINYGMYIVSSRNAAGRFNGQIANTVFQITSDPPTVAVSINKQNLTHEFITESKVLSISILSRNADLQSIGKFGFKSGRDVGKFMNDTQYNVGLTGAPIVLDHAVGYLEGNVIGGLDVGTHTVFAVQLVDAKVLDPTGEPMTYAYYHEIKKGKTPESAPTFVNGDAPRPTATLKAESQSGVQKTAGSVAGMNPEKREAGSGGMKKYVCKVCGYVYDPEKGDPSSGIIPGTPFERLPNEWLCPVCGVPKTEFEELK